MGKSRAQEICGRKQIFTSLPQDAQTAKALRRAGWDYDMIARELDVSLRDAKSLCNGLQFNDHISSYRFGEVKYEDFSEFVMKNGSSSKVITEHYRIPAEQVPKWLYRLRLWEEKQHD